VLIAVMALLSVACERRPMEEEYLRVYLDLHINRNVINYEVGSSEPGLMRVAFFDATTKEYLSHDFVSHNGGYIFAPYGDVDMLVYNIDAGETHLHNYYVWEEIEAYTDRVSELQISRFQKFLHSQVETRPSYTDVRFTPGHLFVARKHNIHIPRHISEDAFIITATASSVVESWTIEVNGITGMEWVGSISMMISGQIGSHLIATDTRSEHPITLYFEAENIQRRSTTMHTRFETFGREKSSGEAAILNILFTDVQGHPYMYNFDVSEQMENNPEQHIVINGDINIPKPEVGGGFKPDVEGWKEFEYDIDI
jgi:hypothetical protein